MKTIIFEKVGPPEEVLQVVERPLPEPKAGEVRIKVLAANIVPADIMFIHGLYGLQPQLPSGAGFEAAGVIDAVGEGAGWAVGTQVIFTAMGAWSEYVVLPAKQLMPSPAGMSPEVACQAFINPLTALGMLSVSGLQAGQTLLLTAANSAFCKMVIQLCAQRGIHTIGTVRSDEQIEGLKALGCGAVINTEKGSFTKQVMEATGGKGVDACFDAVGGTVGAKALNCLKQQGTMLVYGLLSLENLPLNSGLLIFKDLTVKGFWLTTWMARLSGEERKQFIGQALAMLASGQLQVDVEARYKVEQIQEAIAHFNRPGRKGKILLSAK